jgi:hypothetical protein
VFSRVLRHTIQSGLRIARLRVVNNAQGRLLVNGRYFDDISFDCSDCVDSSPKPAKNRSPAAK